MVDAKAREHRAAWKIIQISIDCKSRRKWSTQKPRSQINCYLEEKLPKDQKGEQSKAGDIGYVPSRVACVGAEVGRWWLTPMF